MRDLWRRLSGGERLLVAVFVVSLPLATPLIRGDGVGYYAYARSMLVDGNFRFEKDWLAANASFVRGVADASGRIRPDKYTSTGYVANNFTVGPALLWLPPLAATHLLVLGAHTLGVTVPADGYAWPYRVTVALATATYAFIGLLLAFQIARRYVPERWALLATLGIWFGSSLPVYMYLNPAWSHAHSAFAVSLFLWYWFGTRGGRTIAQWIVLGLLGALMANVYYPNAVLLIVPGLEALRTYAGWKIERVGHMRDLAIRHLAFAGAVLVGLLPTLITRKIIYGSVLETGQPGLNTWCWGVPWLREVLFSSYHGLFSWTPILLPAMAGLVLVAARDREAGLYLIAASAMFYYLIASYPTWHGLSSFGNRFFVSLTPVFIVGLAAVLAGVARGPAAAAALPIVVGVLVLWNFGLIFQWGTKMIPNRGPVTWGEVIRNQVEVVPGRVFAVAAGFSTNRDRLLSMIQQEDLREAESWGSTLPPCRTTHGE